MSGRLVGSYARFFWGRLWWTQEWAVGGRHPWHLPWGDEFFPLGSLVWLLPRGRGSEGQEGLRA